MNRETCPHRIGLEVIRRPGNVVALEHGCFGSNRCRLKTPKEWDGFDPRGTRWLYSGGSPMVFGHCDSHCPLSDTRTALFASTVARPDPSGFGYLLMNRRRGGYSASCRHYKTLLEMYQDNRIRFGPRGHDEHSPYIEAHAIGADGKTLPEAV